MASASTALGKELVYLVLQFLKEENFKETLHKMEQESGVFFDMRYMEEKALSGEWEVVEKYFSGFTKVDDNRFSMKIFFEIRKQKYLEALDRKEKAMAIDILVNDLKQFATINEELYKEIAFLVTLDNIRENGQLARYGDVKSARSVMVLELKKLVETNPVFKDKLVFPTLNVSRLRTLVNQSLNWQHQLCKNPRLNPDIRTLFTDHVCSNPSGSHEPTTHASHPFAILPQSVASYGPVGVPGGPFPHAPTTSSVNTLLGWMVNASASPSVQSPVVAGSPLPGGPSQVSFLKNPRTPSTGFVMMDYQNNEHEQLLKRLRTTPSSCDEVISPLIPQPVASWTLDDLPRTVICSLHQGPMVTSMDFHNSIHSLVVVGCGNGEISIWETGLKEKLLTKPFKAWSIGSFSVSFQAAYAKDSSMSVSRVTWSPDGNYIGVAFTKHLIHLYMVQAPNDLKQQLEVDAHVGCVNDLVFSCPSKQLCIVTCGDDKLIKVWDFNGRNLFNFEGHEAAVYSLCPHQKENIKFIFSTSVDGKIKAWLYDTLGSRVNYDSPGKWCTSMLYSTNGHRLFSCSTSKDGDSFLFEWNEAEGVIKRTYSGLDRKSIGVVQFDTAKNRFLAVGEDNQIKFWDMDNANILASTDVGGILPNVPRLKFNKVGNLLCVSTTDGGFKILANADGIKYLRNIEARSNVTAETQESSSVVAISKTSPPTNMVENVDQSSPAKFAPDVVEHNVQTLHPLFFKYLKNGPDPKASNATKKSWDLKEVVDPNQCQTVTMPDSKGVPLTMAPTNKVAQLLYTNSGAGLLAIGSKGIQMLWRWSRNELNPSGKAMASVVPQLWKPSSGLQMTNDVPNNVEATVSCMALSKNDSYVMASCGGKISLFNMMTFKVMAKFMPPPSRSTFLAFHPLDNNIIAIGMEDSSIYIYNVRLNEVKSKLKGHEKHITGLAFSTLLGLLVSSSADGQLFFWGIDLWKEKKSVMIQTTKGDAVVGDTWVQFHMDKVHLLLSHESLLAIYDVSKMECIRKWWLPKEGISGTISSAAYSCNGKLIYAAFTDGIIIVFDAESLKIKCRITSSAYLCQTLSRSQNVHPLAIAAHPKEPSQFAIGLSDGTIKVIEPKESEGNGTQKNVRTPSPALVTTGPPAPKTVGPAP